MTTIPVPNPRLSVIIPTHQRLEPLEQCLRSLKQTGVPDGTFEILVSVDGADRGEGVLVRRLGVSAQVLVGEQGGPGQARNRAIQRARGGLLLLLNDDVEAATDLIGSHLRAHEGRDTDLPAMVRCAAPWKVHQPDRLFDRLIRETSMVFFYDQMPPRTGPTDPGHDWGFRHAWTLNLSVPTAIARAVGGFSDRLPNASFEDLEWAWRVQQRFGSPVLFRPDAIVTHDHRYEPEAYLQRERRLGRDAWALARANPSCACEVFGRDLRAPDELMYSRGFVDRERTTAQRLERGFLGLAELAAGSVTEPAVLELIYQQHLLLKRWHWRTGLLDAAGRDPEFSIHDHEPVHAG